MQNQPMPPPLPTKNGTISRLGLGGGVAIPNMVERQISPFAQVNIAGFTATDHGNSHLHSQLAFLGFRV